jgi:hypothetical protein
MSLYPSVTKILVITIDVKGTGRVTLGINVAIRCVCKALEMLEERFGLIGT